MREKPLGSQPPTYKLVKGSEDKVYFIEAGKKRLIPNPGIFQAMGFKNEDVKTLSDGELNEIPSGDELPIPAKYSQSQKAGEWYGKFYSWDGKGKPALNFSTNTDNQFAELNLGSDINGIKFDWGDSSFKNDTGLLSDNFVIAAYKEVSFEGGIYTFSASGDDGFQIFAKNVDTDKIINITPDQWTQAYEPEQAFKAQVTLNGKYVLYFNFYEQNGDSRFDLSWEKENPIPDPLDEAGNTPKNARNLENLLANNQGRYNFTANDFVGNVDQDDFYRFKLDNASTFNLTLNGLNADANLQLIRDKNDNGEIDSDDETFTSNSTGTSQDLISRVLETGTYFVRVFQEAFNANTNYSLNFLADLNWGIIFGQNAFGQTLTHKIGFQRVDTSSQAIESNKPTWVIIHGKDNDPLSSDINLLANAIDKYQDGDQVFALDWSSAAKGFFPGTGASWIETAAFWAVQKLVDWGIGSSNISLAGHSLGAYVSAEIAERISGGVNRLLAFDPAKSLPGGYESEEIDFSKYSQWSWGFYSSSFGNSGRTTTADDAFTLGFGFNNPEDNHGNGLDLFASMLGRNDSVSSLFKLEQMGQRPWMLDQFDESGERFNPLGGKYEGRIEAKLESGRWVPNILRYRAAKANWWDADVELRA